MALQNPDRARIAMENGAAVAGGAELIDKVKLMRTWWLRRLTPTYALSVFFFCSFGFSNIKGPSYPEFSLGFGYNIVIIYCKEHC